jgi:hypothetical protein
VCVCVSEGGCVDELRVVVFGGPMKLAIHNYASSEGYATQSHKTNRTWSQPQIGEGGKALWRKIISPQLGY